MRIICVGGRQKGAHSTHARTSAAVMKRGRQSNYENRLAKVTSPHAGGRRGRADHTHEIPPSCASAGRGLSHHRPGQGIIAVGRVINRPAGCRLITVMNRASHDSWAEQPLKKDFQMRYPTRTDLNLFFERAFLCLPRGESKANGTIQIRSQAGQDLSALLFPSMFPPHPILTSQPSALFSQQYTFVHPPVRHVLLCFSA